MKIPPTLLARADDAIERANQCTFGSQPPTGHKPGVGSNLKNKNRMQAYDKENRMSPLRSAE